MAKQNCLRNSKYGKWNHLDGMTRKLRSDGVLCSDLIIRKWFFSYLEGEGLVRESLGFWRNNEVWNFSTTYWMIYRPEPWGSNWGLTWFITITCKGLFEWWSLPSGESRSKIYISDYKRNILPNVSCWLLKDFKHFFLIYPELKYFIDIWNWQSILINGCAEAFIEPILLTF